MQALRYAEFGTKFSYIVCTDSKSSIHALRNVLADQAARTAAQADIVENITVRPDDIKQYLKQEFSGVCQSEWDRTDAKLRTIKPKITPLPM
ncbi:hypothetical protein JTB14_035994 [Gonioctena quinquepunctata]|nr:hypothetical protein JTB14_035994 [Gonioctena quinquepunctata]